MTLLCWAPLNPSLPPPHPPPPPAVIIIYAQNLQHEAERLLQERTYELHAAMAAVGVYAPPQQQPQQQHYGYGAVQQQQQEVAAAQDGQQLARDQQWVACSTCGKWRALSE